MIMVKMTIKEAVPMHRELKADQLYVTVDTLILSVTDGKLCLLLSPRKDPPYEGRPALPGKFIGTEESAEEAVQYLMDEMLPGAEVFREQLYTFTEVNRDPRGRVISAAYLVILPQPKLEKVLSESGTPLRPYRVSLDGEQPVMAGADGTVLTGGDLAFDHGRIIETGIRRLRGKIDYTDIAFHFLRDPEAFSLGELQTVFEAVLGTKLDSSNFRRGILNRYEKSGKLRQTAQAERKNRGRPAVLYQVVGG